MDGWLGQQDGGGLDPSSPVIIWALSELIRSPEILATATAEGGRGGGPVMYSTHAFILNSNSC